MGVGSKEKTKPVRVALQGGLQEGAPRKREKAAARAG